MRSILTRNKYSGQSYIKLIILLNYFHVKNIKQVRSEYLGMNYLGLNLINCETAM